MNLRVCVFVRLRWCMCGCVCVSVYMYVHVHMYKHTCMRILLMSPYKNIVSVSRVYVSMDARVYVYMYA